jgi:SAM-dependent methyltransferase
MPNATPSTVAEQYRDGSHGEEYFAYQQRDAEIASLIAVTRFAPYVEATDSVADFGCGTGWLLRHLTAAEKVGIEPNPAARDHAAAIGIRTVDAAERLDEASVDVVVSNHALEHSLSPYDELVALRRVLRPGGRIVLCLPVDDWRARAQRRPDDGNPDHHLFTWTPLLIANLLGAAGYEVDSARAFTYLQPYYNHALFPLLPRPLFDLLAKLFGRLKRYHQLLVVAHRPAVA